MTGRLADKWRALLVAGSVAAWSPALVSDVSISVRTVATVLILVQAAALWWLADRLWLGTAVVLLVSAGLQLLFPSFGPGIAFVVLCTYAWLRPAAETLWILGLAVVTVCGPAALHGRWTMAGLWLGAVLLAWSWGALVRARGERQVAERRQAVLEERARIARDLHDVLSHTVSVMVVQAAAADDVFDRDPAKAREAIRSTEEAGRQALTELRGFLRTVRADADPDDAGPQPTLADLPRLTGTMSSAGLHVTLDREGAGEVPLGVQVSAYRIVQEALTNTLRHARASSARVFVRVGADEVLVRVTDDGPGSGRAATPARKAAPDQKAAPDRNAAPARKAAPDQKAAPVGNTAPDRTAAPDRGIRRALLGRGSGQGLIGMRERATLLGGTLRAGPRTDAPGFEVEATLPVREKM